MEKIKHFLSETFYFEFGDEITEETDLLGSKVIDSQGYMKVLLFLQEEFGVTMTEDELFTEVLVSARQISDFVVRKT